MAYAFGSAKGLAETLVIRVAVRARMRVPKGIVTDIVARRRVVVEGTLVDD